MREPLHLKYRPKRFEDMIGQRENVAVLSRMVEADDVPLGLLFCGPSGTGKTSAARILASSMESTEVLELDAASNGGVDDVRKIIAATRYSTGGKARVIILDEAHSITAHGFQALLKTLEEPQLGNYFVLVTTEPHKIPRNIISRLMEFQFRSITAGEIATRLAQAAVAEKIQITGPLVMHLAQLSEGNARAAFQGLDKASRANIRTVEEYAALTGAQDPAPSLLAALNTGNHASIFALLDEQLSTIGSPGQIQALLVECLRDLFVLKAGGTLQFTGAPLEARRELSIRIEQERLLFAVKTLWDVKTRLRVADDARGNLELALILIAEAFTRGKIAPAPEPAKQPEAASPEPAKSEPVKRLTLAEMRSSKKVT